MDTTLLTTFATPDGRRVAVVGQNGEVQVWQLGPHRLVARLQIPGPHPLHSSLPPPIELDASGEMLAAAGDDGRVRVWRLEPLELLLAGTPTPPGTIRITPDDRSLVHSGPRPVLGLALSKDGEMLATSDGAMITLWNIATGAKRDSMWLEGRNGVAIPVGKLTFAGRSGLLLAGTWDGWIYGIDARRMRIEWLADTGLGQLRLLQLDPWERYIMASGVLDQTVRLFDAHSRAEVCRIDVPFPQVATFSRNGYSLVIGDGRSGITIVEVQTCRILARHRDFAGSVWGAWFAPGCGSVIVALNVMPRLYERRIPGLVDRC